MPWEEIVALTKSMAAACKQHGVRGRLGGVLKEYLTRHLPSDAHVRCSDKLYFAVTRGAPPPPVQLSSAPECAGCPLPGWWALQRAGPGD